jgi:hypothetical protein
LEVASESGSPGSAEIVLGSIAFFAPPAFVAELAATRTVGFALARHRAQAGVFLDGEEVAFDNLAAVAEFVRRVYLSGGGGDGTNESGGVAPLPSPEGGTRPSEAGMVHLGGDGENDPAGALLAFTRHYLQLASKTKDGASTPSPPPPMLPIAGGPGADVRGRRLVRGALRVLREINRRRPNRDAMPDVLRWLATLEHFATIATRMGLWPMLGKEFQDERTFAAWLYNRPSQQKHDEIDEIIQRFPFDPYGIRHHYPGYMLPLSGHVARDCLDILAQFPVLPEVVPFAAPSGQNLQTLLVKVAAAPLEMFQANDQRFGEERAELALFAAACLNLHTDWCPDLWYFDRRICIQFLDRLADLALAWLGSNLPKFIYSLSVEGVIAGASKVPA